MTIPLHHEIYKKNANRTVGCFNLIDIYIYKLIAFSYAAFVILFSEF